MLVSCWGDRLAIVGILASLNEILESTLYPEMACTSSDTPTQASAGVCVYACMYACMYVIMYVYIHTICSGAYIHIRKLVYVCMHWSL